MGVDSSLNRRSVCTGRIEPDGDEAGLRWDGCRLRPTRDTTPAAMRACRDAISSDRTPYQLSGRFMISLSLVSGSISGVPLEQMKLQIKLGVPHPLQKLLDIDKQWKNLGCRSC
ncbi:hypothetical protein Dimus_035241 [Dionaea muscipula]